MKAKDLAALLLEHPDFEVVGVKYTIKYDSSDDFYYIEKVLD